MKLLKPFLFGLSLTALSSCEKPQTQSQPSEKKELSEQVQDAEQAEPKIDQPTEFVLRLANNMGKHTVADGCEIEFYADTRGTLRVDKIINGKSQGGSSIDLDPNELVSFYWESDKSTLWTITPAELCKSTYEESGSSSTTLGYTKKSLSENLDNLKSPAAVASIAQHYVEHIAVNELPGLHLKNIFGEHQMGDQTINCYLDTKGKVWIGTKGGGSALWSSEKKEVSIYYNSETQQIWTLSSKSFSKEELAKNSSGHYNLSAKALERREAPAKVIELAKELNPSL